jgi:hypothetical protein
MPRLVDECPYRKVGGEERDGCEICSRRLAEFGRAFRVSRAACEACCRSSVPRHDRLNGAVASLLYREACRLLEAPGLSAEIRRNAATLRREAEESLDFDRDSPDHADWIGPVPGPLTTAELIDREVNPETFAAHLRADEPFAYLRYNDGEWLSILGHRGRNTDEHDFFPETLGRDLSLSLEYLAGLWPENGRIYAGLNTYLYQDAIRRHLAEHRLFERVRWVGDNLFGDGLHDLSTYRFIEAVKAHDGRKTLVANRTLAPVAKGLGCRHVVIARKDCYVELGRMIKACAFRGPGLLICCAGMASECLIHRAHEANPRGSYVDCGHIFDALVGNRSREYTRIDADGILELLETRYAPLVFGRRTRRS